MYCHDSRVCRMEKFLLIIFPIRALHDSNPPLRKPRPDVSRGIVFRHFCRDGSEPIIRFVLSGVGINPLNWLKVMFVYSLWSLRLLSCGQIGLGDREAAACQGAEG